VAIRTATQRKNSPIAYEYLCRELPAMAGAYDAYHAEVEAAYERYRTFIKVEHKALKAKLKALSSGNDG
jgi:hypothetical protein